MSGIYGSFLKKKNGKELFSYFSNNNQYATKEEVNYNSYVLGRVVLNKHTNDRFLYEDENFIINFEGINYTKEYKEINDFINSYLNEGISFIKEIKGVFSGYLLDKKENKIFIFNDNLASKSIFYYHTDNGFIFSSELRLITKVMSNYNFKKTLDVDGIYLLSLYGHMLDNLTVIEEVKRLQYSSILTYDINNNEVEIEQYHRYKKATNDDMTLEEAIEGIDYHMRTSITDEWNKDIEYNEKHFSLISGGMDAKTNLLLAKEYGFSNITTMTFGQYGSSDVKIAEKLSIDNGFTHISTYLDNGNHLLVDFFEEYIKVTDGLILCNASAHMQSSISRINFTEYGTLHSGQIGDVLFGSYLKSDNYRILNDKANLGYTGKVKDKKLLNKIKSLNAIINRYKDGTDYELYSYEQRQINGTIMGDKAISNRVDHVSPFYNRDLIDFCLTIPDTFKENQRIYFEWLKAKHPHLLEYKWDKIDMKPTSSFKIKYGKIFKKYYNGARKYFNWNYDSMTPVSKWIKTNPKILIQMNQIFNNEINKIESAELRNDLSDIYNSDVFEYRNKFAVLTSLLSIKFHFND